MNTLQARAIAKDREVRSFSQMARTESSFVGVCRAIRLVEEASSIKSELGRKFELSGDYQDCIACFSEITFEELYSHWQPTKSMKAMLDMCTDSTVIGLDYSEVLATYVIKKGGEYIFACSETEELHKVCKRTLSEAYQYILDQAAINGWN